MARLCARIEIFSQAERKPPDGGFQYTKSAGSVQYARTLPTLSSSGRETLTFEVAVAGNPLHERLHGGVIKLIADDQPCSGFVLGHDARLAQQGLGVTRGKNGLAVQELVLQEFARLRFKGQLGDRLWTLRHCDRIKKEPRVIFQ